MKKWVHKLKVRNCLSHFQTVLFSQSSRSRRKMIKFTPKFYRSIINIFAKQLDFLSIGTNDLIQYTLAIDRIDDQVNYLYDPLHPSVLKLINQILQAGRRANIPVAMCGEMAGDPRYTRLLLGMGLQEFSAHPSNLLEIKQIINRSKISDLEKPTKKILSTTVPDKIGPLVDALNE